MGVGARTKTYGTVLRCSQCNSEMPIQRKVNRKREAGHIKHMYCYHCKDKTAFIEQSKWGIEIDVSTATATGNTESNVSGFDDSAATTASTKYAWDFNDWTITT